MIFLSSILSLKEQGDVQFAKLMILSISHAHLLNMSRPVIIPPLTISLFTECNLSFYNNTQWGHTYFSHLAINMQKWCQFFHFHLESHDVIGHTHG